MKISFICPTHGYFNCEEIGQDYCPKCKEESCMKSDRYGDIQFIDFKPFYSTCIGERIESRAHRDKIARERDLVIGDDKDLTVQVAQNKARRKKEFKNNFREGLKKQLTEVFQ